MRNTLQYAERIAYSSKETLHFTYEMAKKYADKPGCYVECGVAAGAQVIAMAYGAPNNIIYGFDSFCGIPWPSNRDDQYPGIRKISDIERGYLPDPGKQLLETTGATSVPIDDVLNHFKESGIKSKVILVPGWFENTVPCYPIGDISILRLDGDLYNSTWVCLQHLFPKVLKGGCVIIDDWNLKGCQDACKEYFELIGYEPEYKFISDISFFIK
jgi:hypothetical protein